MNVASSGKELSSSGARHMSWRKLLSIAEYRRRDARVAGTPRGGRGQYDALVGRPEQHKIVRFVFA